MALPQRGATKSDHGPITHLESEPSSSTTSPVLAQDQNVDHEPSHHDDPAIKSTWVHRAWLASGCTVVLMAIAKSIASSIGSRIWVEPILAFLIGYVFADFGSGVYHWAIDNYGSATTPIFGAQIEGFQGHHKRPWVITTHDLANNLHALAQAVTVLILPVNLISNNPTLLAFIGSASGFVLFSQQFHSWSHSSKSNLPHAVVALQDLGLILSRPQHAAHHHLPYESNYCIVSGICNGFLDDNKVFEGLEKLIFFLFGVRPRSWGEPSL